MAGKGIALLMVLGLAVIGIVAALSGGDGTEGATNGVDAEVAGVTERAEETETAASTEDADTTSDASEPSESETTPDEEPLAVEPAASTTTTSVAPTTTTTTTSTTTTSSAPSSNNDAANNDAANNDAATTPVAPPATTAPPAASPPATSPPTTSPPTQAAPDTNDDESNAEGEASEDDEAATTTPGPDTDTAGNNGSEEAIADSALPAPGTGQVAFFNGEFVRLDTTRDGIAFASSPTGSEWEVAPTSGLPQDAFVLNIVPAADGLVAIIELVPDITDPFEILFDSGLLTDTEINNLCDVSVDAPGEPIIVTSCDFEELDAAFADLEDALENASTDEERAQIETEFNEFESQFFEGVEILRIEPGDELYDVIVDAFFAREVEFDGPVQIVATSADGIDWSTAELPNIPSADGGFTFVNSVAVSGDKLALLMSVEQGFTDPFEALVTAGVIPEETIDSICSIESGGRGDPIVISTCNFDVATNEGDEGDTDEGDIEEVEILRLVPGDEFYDQLVEAFGEPPAGTPIVLVGSIGGEFGGEFTVAELPVDGFPATIVGTNEGFMATVFDAEGFSRVLRSRDGLAWTVVEEFSPQDEAPVAIELAANNDRAVAIEVEFDVDTGETGAPVVLATTDLGDSWSDSEIPTELFAVSQTTFAGPAGFATLITGTVEPLIPFDFEVVEIEQDGFVMEVPLDGELGALRTTDGVVIHDNVSYEEAFESGEVPGVLRINEAEDAVWLDPDTGDVLIVFLVDDIVAEIDRSFEENGGSGIGAAFVNELWFSPDGETWTLLNTFPSEDEGSFTSVGAVGDDEVLLRREVFVVAPEALFAFEEEGRDPTPEEEAALEEFFGQGSSIEWIRIAI